jgi:hypothetical protein
VLSWHTAIAKLLPGKGVLSGPLRHYADQSTALLGATPYEYCQAVKSVFESVIFVLMVCTGEDKPAEPAYTILVEGLPDLNPVYWSPSTTSINEPATVSILC